MRRIIVHSILLFTMITSCSSQEFQFIQAAPTAYGNIDTSIERLVDGAVVEKVTINPQKNRMTNQTIERKGILVRRKHAKANILMCHGFMCNKFDIGFVRTLFGPDYNFLAFDFRAHGEITDGQVCTFGRDESLDVFAAAQFMKHHPDIKHLPLFAYGFSMGAASAIEAQAAYPFLFKGMILDCPFDSTEEVLKRSIDTLSFSVCGYTFYVPGRTLLQKYAFHPYVQSILKPLLKIVAHMDTKHIETQICSVKPYETIKKIDIPCFFICCKNDEKVSVDAIKRLFHGARGPKKLWITNGRTHCDSFFYNPEGYGAYLNRFMRSVLSGSIYNKRSAIVEDAIDLGSGGKII